jgi:hypothetical protein
MLVDRTVEAPEVSRNGLQLKDYLSRTQRRRINNETKEKLRKTSRETEQQRHVEVSFVASTPAWYGQTLGRAGTNSTSKREGHMPRR